VRSGRRRGGAGDRGHGLGIARRAIRDAGGTFELERDCDGTVAAIELPLAYSGDSGRRSPRKARS
jgi:hypothetical protein